MQRKQLVKLKKLINHTQERDTDSTVLEQRAKVQNKNEQARLAKAAKKQLKNKRDQWLEDQRVLKPQGICHGN